VLVVSGIWPPDIGGPATHAPELAAWLVARGHSVEAMTTAGPPPPREPYPVRWTSRSLPLGLRHAAVIRSIAARARAADVVYATSMLARAAAGALLARVPYVLKVTSDPAFERARRRGLVAGETAEFQHGGGGSRVAALRGVRDLTVRRAAHVLCPSEFMAELVCGWGVPSERVTVLPNPAPSVDEAGIADVPERPLLVFAGRLTAAKNLDLALRAVAAVPEATLVVVGDGDERERLEEVARSLELNGRVRFLGARSRAETLGLLRAADAALLSSAWENFPHAAVEALAMGTPVVATAVGGIPEVVHDGENGLLVPTGDERALAAAVRRIIADEALRERLRSCAAPSVARFGADEVYAQLERILLAAVR
jgi:glycosyltransferase involved in cell wall biosynthesis